MRTVGPKFGNHIVIKAPENKDEQTEVVAAFRQLAARHNVKPLGETVLVASVEDPAKDKFFIKFAKNRHLQYTDIPLTVNQVDAIKQARRFFGLDLH